jgi:hypothetical protein
VVQCSSPHPSPRRGEGERSEGEEETKEETRNPGWDELALQYWRREVF